MRLQEIYAMCLDAISIWNTPTFEETNKSNSPPYFKLNERSMVLHILSILKQIKCFDEHVEKIRSTSISLSQEDNSIYFDTRGKNIFIDEFKKLEMRVHTLISFFESLEHEPVEGIDVKLPANLSLIDLSNCTKDLHHIFSTCISLTNSTGDITLSSVDIGSSWLNFLITGGVIAVITDMIASLVDKALIIRSHYITTKQQLEQMRTLKLSNDLLEQQININSNVEKMLIDNIGQELASKNNVTGHEDIERLKLSVKLLSNWMDKGMELYASVKCPIEVQAVFPPFETQFLSPQNLELLSSGSKDNSSESTT